jgi:hypothetical protein
MRGIAAAKLVELVATGRFPFLPLERKRELVV